MRLLSLAMVNRCVAERERLLKLRAEVEADQLNVTIRGTYQDDAMAALVRPVVLRELSGRVSEIERDLLAFGLTLD